MLLTSTNSRSQLASLKNPDRMRALWRAPERFYYQNRMAHFLAQPEAFWQQQKRLFFSEAKK
jgi:hypothetical protein